VHVNLFSRKIIRIIGRLICSVRKRNFCDQDSADEVGDGFTESAAKDSICWQWVMRGC